MHCPFCNTPESRVVDTRISEDGYSIRRRRLCENCERRFSTNEIVQLCVVKRDGNLQSFKKAKILNGIAKAAQGRQIDSQDLKKIADEVEDKVRSQGLSQIDSYEIGHAVLEPLRKIDEIAYLRYASVYKGFKSLDDYIKEIKKLTNLKHKTPNK
ncbi:MAG: transcriptional regulator NrdR [Bifidobacteriaceae bacterium]|jgi:transcriptional repressor NrdR|nr:transcriptional regulator NrdR [Bifidobacteriaceae bacterium]